MTRVYSGSKRTAEAPQLYNIICDVFTSIQNRMPHVNKEQIKKIIGLPYYYLMSTEQYENTRICKKSREKARKHGGEE